MHNQFLKYDPETRTYRAGTVLKSPVIRPADPPPSPSASCEPVPLERPVAKKEGGKKRARKLRTKERARRRLSVLIVCITVLAFIWIFMIVVTFRRAESTPKKIQESIDAWRP